MRQTTVKDCSSTPVWAPCAGCNRETAHREHAHIAITDTDGHEHYFEDHSLLQCQGCLEITYCVATSNTYESTHDPETGEEDLLVRRTFYPKRQVGRALLENIYSVPSGVRSIYTETHGAVLNGQPVLSAIGIRAIVETVCQDKQVTGKNLQDKIDNLVTAGVLTIDGAKILHVIRYMGNDAAHEAKVHTEGELANALEVVEHLLTGVYVIPALAPLLGAESVNKVFGTPTSTPAN